MKKKKKRRSRNFFLFFSLIFLDANGLLTCNQCQTGIGRSVDGCNQNSNTSPAPSFYTGSSFVACQTERCNSCTGNNAETCSSCIEGYYLDSNSCVKCGTNCLACTSTECSTCEKGYYVDTVSDQKNCVSCPISNCELCESASVCKKCSDSYFLLLPAGSSCISSCTGPGKTANAGYFLFFLEKL